MEDILTKLMDYGVLGLVVYILITQIIRKLDNIERCLEDLKRILSK
jgi:hypothetical protein